MALTATSGRTRDKIKTDIPRRDRGLSSTTVLPRPTDEKHAVPIRAHVQMQPSELQSKEGVNEEAAHIAEATQKKASGDSALNILTSPTSPKHDRRFKLDGFDMMDSGVRVVQRSSRSRATPIDRVTRRSCYSATPTRMNKSDEKSYWSIQWRTAQFKTARIRADKECERKHNITRGIHYQYAEGVLDSGAQSLLLKETFEKYMSGSIESQMQIMGYDASQTAKACRKQGQIHIHFLSDFPAINGSTISMTANTLSNEVLGHNLISIHHIYKNMSCRLLMDNSGASFVQFMMNDAIHYIPARFDRESEQFMVRMIVSSSQHTAAKVGRIYQTHMTKDKDYDAKSEFTSMPLPTSICPTFSRQEAQAFLTHNNVINSANDECGELCNAFQCTPGHSEEQEDFFQFMTVKAKTTTKAGTTINEEYMQSALKIENDDQCNLCVAVPATEQTKGEQTWPCGLECNLCEVTPTVEYKVDTRGNVFNVLAATTRSKKKPAESANTMPTPRSPDEHIDLEPEPGEEEQTSPTYPKKSTEHAKPVPEPEPGEQTEIEPEPGEEEKNEGIFLRCKKWTRSGAQQRPHNLYLFGENDMHRGTGHIQSTTQAVIRGIDNSCGIRTCSAPGVGYKDENVEDNMAKFSQDLNQAFKQFKAGSYTNIIIPELSFGSGDTCVSQLENEAPATFYEFESMMDAFKTRIHKYLNYKQARNEPKVEPEPDNPNQMRTQEVMDDIDLSISQESNIRGAKAGMHPRERQRTEIDMHNRHGHIGHIPGCKVCAILRGKLRSIFAKVDPFQDILPGHRWHGDVITWSERNRHGEKYTFGMRDECSDTIVVENFKLRSELTEVVSRCIMKLRNNTDYGHWGYPPVQQLRLDRDGAWRENNTEFVDAMDKINVRMEWADGKDKRSHSIAENLMKQIEMTAKSMLIQTSMQPMWWGEAVHMAALIRNCYPTTSQIVSSDGDASRPLEILSKGRRSRRQLDNVLHHAVAFGSLAMVSNGTVKGSNITASKARFGICIGMNVDMPRWICPYRGVEFQSKQYVEIPLPLGVSANAMIGIDEPPLPDIALPRLGDGDSKRMSKYIITINDFAHMIGTHKPDMLKFDGVCRYRGTSKPLVSIADKHGNIYNSDEHGNMQLETADDTPTQTEDMASYRRSTVENMMEKLSTDPNWFAARNIHFWKKWTSEMKADGSAETLHLGRIVKYSKIKKFWTITYDTIDPTKHAVPPDFEFEEMDIQQMREIVVQQRDSPFTATANHTNIDVHETVHNVSTSGVHSSVHHGDTSGVHSSVHKHNASNFLHTMTQPEPESTPETIGTNVTSHVGQLADKIFGIQRHKTTWQKSDIVTARNTTATTREFDIESNTSTINAFTTGERAVFIDNCMLTEQDLPNIIPTRNVPTLHQWPAQRDYTFQYDTTGLVPGATYYDTEFGDTFIDVVRNIGIHRNRWKQYYQYIGCSFGNTSEIKIQKESSLGMYFNHPWRKQGKAMIKKSMMTIFKPGTRFPIPTDDIWSQMTRESDNIDTDLNIEHMAWQETEVAVSKAYYAYASTAKIKRKAKRALNASKMQLSQPGKDDPEQEALWPSAIYGHEAMRKAGLIGKDGRISPPESYTEAKTRPDFKRWQAACDKELAAFIMLNAIEGGHTLDEIRTKKMITSGPIPWASFFTCKYCPKGYLVKYKNRRCLLGHSGNAFKGEHYTDTFAPTPLPATTRAVQAMALKQGHKRLCFDICTAFLHAETLQHERCPIRMPEGEREYKMGADGKMHEIYGIMNRQIYGMPNSSKRFQQVRDAWILSYFSENGWTVKRADSDPCLFTITRGKHVVQMLCHSDDSDLTSPSMPTMHAIMAAFHKKFGVEECEPKFMLGIERTRTEDGKYLEITQTGFIEQLWEQFRHLMKTTRAPNIPVPFGTFITRVSKKSVTAERWAGLEAEGKRIHDLDFRSLLGSCLWCARMTRPECLVGCSMMAKVMCQPTQEAFDVGLSMVAYMYANRHTGIRFSAADDLTPVAFYDSSNRADATTGKSQHGHLIMMAGGPVVFESKIHRHVAMSASHSEYMAQRWCVQNVSWLRKLLVELDMEDLVTDPTPLAGDNDTATRLSYDLMVTTGNRFYMLEYHHCKEAVRRGISLPCRIDTHLNIADPMTKVVSNQTLSKLGPMMRGYGMQGVPTPEDPPAPCDLWPDEPTYAKHEQDPNSTLWPKNQAQAFKAQCRQKAVEYGRRKYDTAPCA